MRPAHIILAVMVAGFAARALADPRHGIPNPRYPDGTGNVAVDQLNNAQLNENYRGPFYYPGRAAPDPAPPPTARPPAPPDPRPPS